MHDFTGEDVYAPAFGEGEYPGFVPGVRLEIIEDDGTDEFDASHKRAVKRESDS